MLTYGSVFFRLIIRVLRIHGDATLDAEGKFKVELSYPADKDEDYLLGQK
jgi:hypothetical protein